MKRMLFAVFAVSLLVPVLTTRSEAFGAETLKCLVSPDPNPIWKTPVCRAKQPKFSYTVQFQVFDGTGTYSYAWDTVTWSSVGTIAFGCGSTDAVCAYSVSAVSDDRTIPMSVAITQGGQQRTLDVSAYLPAVCEFLGSAVWC